MSASCCGSSAGNSASGGVAAGAARVPSSSARQSTGAAAVVTGVSIRGVSAPRTASANETLRSRRAGAVRGVAPLLVVGLASGDELRLRRGRGRL